jgi:hypothetical protein
MRRGKKDEDREERIRMEIVVDGYERHERVSGWYVYLEERLETPFEARCIEERDVSPLTDGETVRVVGMSPIDACESEMFVTVDWMDRELGVPLAQLEPVDAPGETAQAIADWHYWNRRNYSF